MGRWLRIIAGAALIAGSFFVPGSTPFATAIASGLFAVGSTLAIGGVQSFLQPRARLTASRLTGQGRLINIQQQASPTRIVYGRQMVDFGAIVWADLTGTNGEYARIAGVICNNVITEVEGVYFDGKLVTGAPTALDFIWPYTPHCFMEINYGYDDQVALPQLVSDTGGLWSETDRCAGHATIYMRIKFDLVAFPNGLPKIEFLVKGAPTEGEDYSANGARVVNDYLTNARYGLGMDFSTRVNADAFTAAVNLSDQDVTIPDFATSPAGSTTEKRYEIHATFETSETPSQILNLMMGALGGGGLPYISGEFHILPAAYRAPALTLSEGDFIAPLSYTSRRSRRDMANSISGTFLSPDKQWKETAFPEVIDAAALALDGEKLSLSISLPFTISESAAQRLAWLALQKIRLQKPLVISTKLTGYAVQPGSGLALDVDALGWIGKAFEVQEVSLAQLSDANSQPVFGISHQLVENPSEIYDDFEDYQELPVGEEPVHQHTVQNYIQLPSSPDDDIPNPPAGYLNIFINGDWCVALRRADGSISTLCPVGGDSLRFAGMYDSGSDEFTGDVVNFPGTSVPVNKGLLFQGIGSAALFHIDLFEDPLPFSYTPPNTSPLVFDGVTITFSPNGEYVAVAVRAEPYAPPDGEFEAPMESIIRVYHIGPTLTSVEPIDEDAQLYKLNVNLVKEIVFEIAQTIDLAIGGISDTYVNDQGEVWWIWYDTQTSFPYVDLKVYTTGSPSHILLQTLRLDGVQYVEPEPATIDPTRDYNLFDPETDDRFVSALAISPYGAVMQTDTIAAHEAAHSTDIGGFRTPFPKPTRHPQYFCTPYSWDDSGTLRFVVVRKDVTAIEDAYDEVADFENMPDPLTYGDPNAVLYYSATHGFLQFSNKVRAVEDGNVVGDEFLVVSPGEADEELIRLSSYVPDVFMTLIQP